MDNRYVRAVREFKREIQRNTHMQRYPGKLRVAVEVLERAEELLEHIQEDEESKGPKI